MPTLIFNSSTGSDTAASGAGPATAVAGTGASTTAASADVDLSVDTPDLSGVATDGTAVLWVDSTSGRQYSAINAVNDTTDVVTCDDTFANTEGARNWGIGGKRATLDNAGSRSLGDDWNDGWIVELETDQTLNTSAFELEGSGTSLIIKSNNTTVRTITQTANVRCLERTYIGGYKHLTLKYLKFENTNATKTSADAINAAYMYIKTEHCIFGDATNKIYSACDAASMLTLFDCEITSCAGTGIDGISVAASGCWIHDCSSRGISGNNTSVILDHCIIEANGSDGVACRSSDIRSINNNVFDANTGDGLDLTVATVNSSGTVLNNHFTNNGGYGIRGSSTVSTQAVIFEGNNFGDVNTNNSSGNYLNVTHGDTEYAIDPAYTDVAGNDWSVGSAVQGKGVPLSTVAIGAGQSSSNNYSDIGAVQHADPAGGGTTNVIATRRRSVARGQSFEKTTRPVISASGGSPTTNYVPIHSTRIRSIQQRERKTQTQIITQTTSGGTEYVPIPVHMRRLVIQQHYQRRPGTVISTTTPGAATVVPVRSKSRVQQQYIRGRARAIIVPATVIVTESQPVIHRRRHIVRQNYTVTRRATSHSHSVTVNQTVVVSSPRKVR